MIGSQGSGPICKSKETPKCRCSARLECRLSLRVRRKYGMPSDGGVIASRPVESPFVRRDGEHPRGDAQLGVRSSTLVYRSRTPDAFVGLTAGASTPRHKLSE